MKIAIIIEMDEEIFDELKRNHHNHNIELDRYNNSNKAAIYEHNKNLARMAYEKSVRKTNRHLKDFKHWTLTELVATFGHKIVKKMEIQL